MKKLISILMVTALALLVPLQANAAPPVDKSAARAAKMAERDARKRAREMARHDKRLAKLTEVMNRHIEQGNIEAAANLQNAIDKEYRRHDRKMLQIGLEEEDEVADDLPDDPGI